MTSATTTPPQPPQPAPAAPVVMPSVAQQMANAANALQKFVASGGKLVDVPTLTLRESICFGCPEKVDSAVGWRCRACGCAGWWKMRAATESCPQGKWPATAIVSAP